MEKLTKEQTDKFVATLKRIGSNKSRGMIVIAEFKDLAEKPNSSETNGYLYMNDCHTKEVVEVIKNIID